MTLLVAWVVFPAVFCLLALGCGLLVELASGIRLPGTLLLPCGVALITVVGTLCATADALAEFALPAIIALTLAGLGFGAPRRSLKPDPWPLAAAAAVFAVFAAPVVLSGDATFAGYIKLDDTATWFAISDRIVDHGRDLSGLAPSTYEATLSATLPSGYPIGSFTPLADTRPLVGIDIAWIFQPYLTVLAAMLALCLYELSGGLLSSPRLRAAVAFIAAQPALLFGYALWGGIKELGVALFVATLAALMPSLLGEQSRARAVIAPLVVGAAMVTILSFGGLAWIGPIALGAVVLALMRGGFTINARRVIGFAALALLLAAPALLTARTFFNSARSGDLAGGELGNLVHPLSDLQVFGIWPVGDFRLRPHDMTVTRLLVLVVLAFAIGGAVYAWRRRGWGLLLYVCSAAFTCVVLVAVGAPWIDGKTLATAAPAILLAAMVGAAALLQGGRRVEGGIVLVVIATGVLWSNLLAYREVWLAPHDQLAELQQIAGKVGRGPVLMTEYQPYGVRHFLRDGNAEGASELRRRVIPLTTGEALSKGAYADLDRFGQPGLRDYNTILLRRSGAESRPPSDYRLTWKGRYYEVWQRVPGAPPPAEHLPLGDVVHPTARARCAEVLRLAGVAGRDGRLAYVERPRAIVVNLPGVEHPASWTAVAGSASVLFPHGDGWLRAKIAIPREDDYRFWLGGSVRGLIELFVDGRKIGAARHQLNNDGQYLDLGSAALAPGIRNVELRYRAGGWRPGSSGKAPGLGPLLVTPDSIDSPVRYLDAANARKLCGRELDWIEALPA